MFRLLITVVLPTERTSWPSVAHASLLARRSLARHMQVRVFKRRRETEKIEGFQVALPRGTKLSFGASATRPVRRNTSS